MPTERRAVLPPPAQLPTRSSGFDVLMAWSSTQRRSSADRAAPSSTASRPASSWRGTRPAPTRTACALPCRADRARRRGCASSSMMSSEPRLAAPCTACSPISFAALTSMPDSRQSCTASIQRAGDSLYVSPIDPVHAGGRHQRGRAVESRDSAGRRPSTSSSRITGTSAACAARMNGVCPVKSTHSSDPSGSRYRRAGGNSFTRALTSTPRSSSARDQLAARPRGRRRSRGRVPLRTVEIANLDRRPERRASLPVRGLHDSRPFDQQLARRRAAPFVIAISSGVMPFGSAAFTSAPASTQQRARHRRSPSRAAKSSGVMPPGPAAARPAAARRCGRCPRRASRRRRPADAPPASRRRACARPPSAPRASKRFMIAVSFAPRSPHQRGMPTSARAFTGAPRSSSSSHRVRVAGAHRRHQQRVARRVGRRHSAPGVEQPPQHGGIACSAAM